MADQIQSPEIQSPEHVSLEKRFGVEKDDKMMSNVEKTVEGTAEKSVTENDGSYQHILSKVKTQNDDSNDDALMQDASSLHQQVDRESQITHLVDLAMTKGVGHAVNVAQKAEDYYVLDQLHDRLLSEELHEALVSNGLIDKK